MPKIWTRASTNSLFCSICRRDCGPSVSAVGSQHQLVAFRAGRQPVGPDAADEVRVPFLGLAHAPEHGVDLDSGNRLGRDVLQSQGDARNELVLAVHDADVIPAAVNVGDGEVLLNFSRATPRHEEHDPEADGQASAAWRNCT